MKEEIERKFLVDGDFKAEATHHQIIKQGYISSDPRRTLRIRISDNKGFITIKGASNMSGTTRFEWEKEITVNEANELLKLCEPGIIEKTRYSIPEKNGLMFEVDVFYGENDGLIIAEIELPNENYPFEKPKWLGNEVTGIERYYNSKLKQLPYKKW